MRLYGVLDYQYTEDQKQYCFYDCIEADWVDQHNGQIRYDKQDWPPQWILHVIPKNTKKVPLEEILMAGSTWFELLVEYVDTEDQADASIHSEQNYFRPDVVKDGYIKIVSKNQTDKVGY